VSLKDLCCVRITLQDNGMTFWWAKLWRWVRCQLHFTVTAYQIIMPRGYVTSDCNLFSHVWINIFNKLHSS